MRLLPSVGTDTMECCGTFCRTFRQQRILIDVNSRLDQVAPQHIRAVVGASDLAAIEKAQLVMLSTCREYQSPGSSDHRARETSIDFKIFRNSKAYRPSYLQKTRT